jgi:hypothetical protein
MIVVPSFICEVGNSVMIRFPGKDAFLFKPSVRSSHGIEKLKMLEV